MELPEELLDDARKRLRRAAGQVQAVERMLEEGRDCREVITQLAAATRALEQTGFRIVAAGLEYCLSDPDNAADEGYTLEDIEKLFLRIS